jgi:hypothetical protein
VLSFTRRKAMAALLSTIVGAVALGWWFFIICTAPVWTRSQFVWFVVPEVCFSLAGFLHWLVQRPRSVGPVVEDRVRANDWLHGSFGGTGSEGQPNEVSPHRCKCCSLPHCAGHPKRLMSC